MKVLIVSGFLGAGKTTFIKELAKNTEQQLVIMENEYGEIPIDGNLFKTKKDDLKIWELTEGCICCSMQGDFASSILTIANTLDPEYLIVEPTGIGLLSAILNNVKNIAYERIEILSPITLLDAQSLDSFSKEFPAIFEDQIISSEMVLITKAEGGGLASVQAYIQRIHPRIPVIADDYRKRDVSFWEGILAKKWGGAVNRSKIEGLPQLESLGIRDVALSGIDELVYKIQVLGSGMFGRIYRAKGYLSISTDFVHFDIVDGCYSIEEMEPMEQSNITVIGKDLKKDDISSLFLGK